MGFFDRLKAEFIDIIEWRDERPGVLVSRFDRYEHEIKMNAKLIVRPGQRAVFVNEGQIADTFGPGTHTLETRNMPILATLKGWKYGFESPFKAEVYFIKTSEQLDCKWGTATPIMLRDRDFGIVRLRARGNYSYHISADAEMISRFVGARAEWTNDDIEGQIRTKLISSFTDYMGELKIPVLDLQANYDEISLAMKEKLQSVYERLGLSLVTFAVENITLPEEVEKAMDQRSSMGVVGDLNKFTQFQAAQALEGMANQEGGGNMMGMMMGANMANSMGNVLHQEQPVAAQVSCPHCNAQVQSGSKFCLSCGQSLTASSQTPCIKCGHGLAAGSKFCPDCGSAQVCQCVECKIELKPGSKFCPECGSKQ
ncbi:MAG: SPFH domain-containing protein [Lentisphaeria bacterium]|nr:SPFH domain-containing protein [Lentisphaeria bacterium]